ncbi:hypothetical protein BGZ95_004131, partial [Linnemannia exigua]
MSKKSYTPTQPGQTPVIHGDIGSDDDTMFVSSQRIRKRDKFLSLFRTSSPEPKVKAKSQNSSPKIVAPRLSTTSTNASVHRLLTVSTHANVETEHA